MKRGYTLETILYNHSFPYYFDMIYANGIGANIMSNSSARLRIYPGAATDYGIDVYSSVGWHHYVIQITPSDDHQIQIYLDGNLVYTVGYTQSSMREANWLCYLGQADQRWNAYMSLDSFRISDIPRYNSNFYGAK